MKCDTCTVTAPWVEHSSETLRPCSPPAWCFVKVSSYLWCEIQEFEHIARRVRQARRSGPGRVNLCWRRQCEDCELVRMLGKWVFGRFPWKFVFYTINEAHKQYSLLDKIFDYIFYPGPPGKYLYLSPQNPLHLAGEAGRQVVDFLYFV